MEDSTTALKSQLSDLHAKLSDTANKDSDNHKHNTQLSHKLKELETDVEIRTKTINKLESDVLTQSSDFNARKLAWGF